jgi:ketosteroid isomerase-like protein
MLADAQPVAYALACRYADAFTHRSQADLRSCWAADGAWTSGPPLDIDVRGGDEIGRVWRERMSVLEFLVMSVRSTVITSQTEERIESRTVLSEYGRRTDGTGVDMYGSYADVLVVEDGRWVYQRRALSVIYRDTPTLPGGLYTPWTD